MGRIQKPKPESEIKLTELQDKWFQTNDKIYLSEMFEIIVNYARSLCLKINRGKVFIDPDRLYGIAVDSAISFMKNYNDKDFRIHASFAGLLRFKVLENLYGNYKQDEDNFYL